ncbi:pilus assembly protein TadG-related protein [Bradyrhizobium sp. SYSU BS000235]|uniref:TadE/TadG family type IV pilus assembly protein n=1 Tax=Bradyrhizobium sp. SYSU BS000235 TaxID=3411332 RepID=UPI003C72FAF6
MSDALLLNRILRRAANFRSAKGGNVAVIFAFSMVPLLLFAGGAIDYTRANAARTAMQEALDSTALMLSKTITGQSSSDVSALAKKYFNALYTFPGAQNIDIKTTYTYNATDGYKLVVDGTGSIPTEFMKLANMNKMDFSSSSTVVWGNTRLRVAMGLDITGSMNDDGKLDAMKTAAKQLVDTLKSTAKSKDDVYLSIIPFNVMVNVGKTYQNASWLDWDTTYGSCQNAPSYKTKSACVNAKKTWVANNVSQWKGCVWDRDKDPNVNYDALNTSPNIKTPGTLYMAQNYTDCSSSLLPMISLYTTKEADDSTDDTTIKGKINNLKANGNTNQAIGLHHAWMSLQLDATVPFPAPAKDSNYKYTDVIILLSDGMNTQDRWYSTQSRIDDRQELLCQNIKAWNGGSTMVYTIQVNTGHDKTSQVLQDCAVNGGKYFLSTSTSDMAAAFNEIGASLNKLRIAK